MTPSNVTIGGNPNLSQIYTIKVSVITVLSRNFEYRLILSFEGVFFCVGVMYSGEYDACDVTLSVYPHRASLRNMPDHGGNRTYNPHHPFKYFCVFFFSLIFLAQIH